jgi:hypothetical protein
LGKEGLEAQIQYTELEEVGPDGFPKEVPDKLLLTLGMADKDGQEEQQTEVEQPPQTLGKAGMVAGVDGVEIMVPQEALVGTLVEEGVMGTIQLLGELAEVAALTILDQTK